MAFGGPIFYGHVSKVIAIPVQPRGTDAADFVRIGGGVGLVVDVARKAAENVAI